MASADKAFMIIMKDDKIYKNTLPRSLGPNGG
jgi:hypothetical protein